MYMCIYKTYWYSSEVDFVIIAPHDTAHEGIGILKLIQRYQLSLQMRASLKLNCIFALIL